VISNVLPIYLLGWFPLISLFYFKIPTFILTVLQAKLVFSNYLIVLHTIIINAILLMFLYGSVIPVTVYIIMINAVLSM